MSIVNRHILRFGSSDEDIEELEYTPKPDHRNNSPEKSQWTITEKDELKCFKNAYLKSWKKGQNAWGLHFNEDVVEYLGMSKDKSTRLFIAKFISDNFHGTWHGYPADYQHKPQDIPDPDILKDWIKNKLLKKAKISKIMQGKPCNL
jgi:hypothetical protein